MNTRISKMGIVGVYLAHEMGNVFEKLSQEQFNGAGFMQHALPYKFASVHFCFENNTFGSAIQTTLMMSLGKYARIRLRSHSGKKLNNGLEPRKTVLRRIIVVFFSQTAPAVSFPFFLLPQVPD